MTLRIVETVTGMYFMHLSETGNNGEPSLCGRRDMMATHYRLEVWNSEPDHIRLKFCRRCNEIAAARGLQLPKPTEKTLIR